jgi:hypothetical protein
MQRPSFAISAGCFLHIPSHTIPSLLAAGLFPTRWSTQTCLPSFSMFPRLRLLCVRADGMHSTYLR